MPWVLHSVVYKRRPETILPELITIKEYASTEYAEVDQDLAAYPGDAPTVAATVELWAIVWKGLQKEEETEAESGRSSSRRR